MTAPKEVRVWKPSEIARDLKEMGDWGTQTAFITLNDHKSEVQTLKAESEKKDQRIAELEDQKKDLSSYIKRCIDLLPKQESNLLAQACINASNRIEQLEKALRELLCHYEQNDYGDVYAEEAHQALKEKG